jgi:hypothetical protein
MSQVNKKKSFLIIIRELNIEAQLNNEGIIFSVCEMKPL